MAEAAPQTLPARYYTREAVFREEMERFYFTDWVCAGRAAAIPSAGDYFVREIAGESVIVVRDSGGLRAFYNVCRHRATCICTEGGGHFGGRIQCPYHGWTYGLDGRLRGAPQMTEADLMLLHTHCMQYTRTFGMGTYS